ncbi:MAG: alpha/beta fold hydrolase [Puniceicoccaceae bacterium]
MILSHTSRGSIGPHLVLLHGMLGNKKNWASILRELDSTFQCHALDLRNHGDSSHRDEMDFDLLAGDLRESLDHLGLDQIILVGHSLGGKVAMKFAAEFPERTEGLLIADIAPRQYQPHFDSVIEILLQIELSNHSSRREIDELLSGKLPDWGFRQFLLTNLALEGNQLSWKSNLRALHSNRFVLAENPLSETQQYLGPTLFVRGGKSSFIRPTDYQSIFHHFPTAAIETFPEAGHNVHTEDRPAFVRAIQSLSENLKTRLTRLVGNEF